ncbi:MAG: hypothetical protein HOV68_15610 [Streptomycetaceae bacterium]|nr:hypothetical protein [Streptomycetaceae bacterium]
MSAREMVAHAVRVYCENDAAADRLLARYDAETAAKLANLQARVDALQADAELLAALEARGVGSWEGYDAAVSAARQAVEGVAS